MGMMKQLVSGLLEIRRGLLEKFAYGAEELTQHEYALLELMEEFGIKLEPLEEYEALSAFMRRADERRDLEEGA
jgi:hypothetical protein